MGSRTYGPPFLIVSVELQIDGVGPRTNIKFDDPLSTERVDVVTTKYNVSSIIGHKVTEVKGGRKRI